MVTDRCQLEPALAKGFVRELTPLWLKEQNALT